MVTPEIRGGVLHLEVEGFDKMWALKSQLDIPLAHITAVRLDEEVVKKWWHGFKFPGSEMPGLLTAGTFYQDGKRVFWDVHNMHPAVVISLNHEHYDELVIEVENPNALVAGLRAKIA